MERGVGPHTVNLTPISKTATDYTDFTETYSLAKVKLPIRNLCHNPSISSQREKILSGCNQNSSHLFWLSAEPSEAAL